MSDGINKGLNLILESSVPNQKILENFGIGFHLKRKNTSLKSFGKAMGMISVSSTRLVIEKRLSLASIILQQW